MAVEKVHLNLSALDIKAAFAGAQDVDVAAGAKGVFAQGEGKKQDALTMGNANHQIGFDEFLNAIALCGHIKYMEVKGSTMAQRVKGSIDNFLGIRSEKEVITDMIYPSAPRTQRILRAAPPHRLQCTARSPATRRSSAGHRGTRTSGCTCAVARATSR